ncbi:hypothetical protein FOMPIDRAFT_1135050, partial [Fomitopsis schrenkii]
ACPYILSPPQCGHTYCALCILRWFFSNVCVHCQGWCQDLACPLCRAPLPEIPNVIPRTMSVLPFTPARAANERIMFLIDSLGRPQDVKSSTPWEHGGHLRTEWQGRDRYVGRHPSHSLTSI